MKQMTVKTSLTEIYAGIEQELCSRHSITLTRIKHKFEHLYSKNKPRWYVICKGLCDINSPISYQGEGLTIENGVIMAIAKTSAKQNIYINYNKWEQQAQIYQKQFWSQQISECNEQLVLNYKGEIQQTVNISSQTENLSNQLRSLYQMAVQDISLSKINGAIFYISSKLETSFFYQKQALYFAFFISILQINQLISQYTIADMREKLMKWAKITGKNQQQIHKIQRYSRLLQNENGQIGNNYEQETQEQKNNKFVIIKVPQQLCFSKTINKQSNSVLHKIQPQTSTNIYDILQKNKSNLFQISSLQQNSLIVGLKKLQQIIKGLIFVQNNYYLILSVHKRNCSQIIRQASQLIKSGDQQQENTKKDILEVQERKYLLKVGKWSQGKGKGKADQTVFSSLPGIGIAVLDPKDQIWFNQ